MNQPLFTPEGPWGTEPVEEMLRKNIERYQSSGYLGAYVTAMANRNRRFASAGVETIRSEATPIALLDPLCMNAMADFLKIALVNTKTGIMDFGSGIDVAFGNDDGVWQPTHGFTDLDLSVITDGIDEAKGLGLTVVNEFGTCSY